LRGDKSLGSRQHDPDNKIMMIAYKNRRIDGVTKGKEEDNDDK
jgi:hypothetical protein